MNLNKILFIIFLIFISSNLYSQEENSILQHNSTHYINLRISSLRKYNKRIKKKETKLTHRLSQKEHKLNKKAKNLHPESYDQYSKLEPSFDSISQLASEDTPVSKIKNFKNGNSAIDTLKKISAFANQSLPKSHESPNPELDQLQKEIGYRKYIAQLIDDRSKSLVRFSKINGNLPGLKSIEKNAFYGKAKMNAFKQMEEDPSKTEEQLLEYLQGEKGFDKAISGSNKNEQGMPGQSAGDLEKMGYQTKSLVQKNIQQQMGTNLTGFTKHINKQIPNLNSQQSKVNELKQTKESLRQIKAKNNTGFKVNPERGLPFKQRLQKEYNWEATRTNEETGRPALLNLSATVGFKHTPKLVHGMGGIFSLGLGQNWQSLQPSFQGLGGKIFTTWKWRYGIGSYISYERIYNRSLWNNNTVEGSNKDYSVHSTPKFTESFLIGISKEYFINTKTKGSIQVLYDVWWNEKNLNSPFCIRFSVIK